MTNDQLDKLALIFGDTGDDKSRVGEAVLELIESATSGAEQREIMKVALTQREDFPSAKRSLPNKGLTEDRWNELNQYHFPIILSHLKLAFVNAQTADEFADSCLKILALFPEADEKIFALSSIIFSRFTPYRQIVGKLKGVSTEEYNTLLKRNQELADDINYVFRLPFEDLPSECLNVLHVLNKTDDEKLKVALLALYVSHQIRRALKSTDD